MGKRVDRPGRARRAPSPDKRGKKRLDRMTRRHMIALQKLLVGALLACALSPRATSSAYGGAAHAKWEAGTCTGTELTVPNCEYTSPPSVFYTQAAGHPSW